MRYREDPPYGGRYGYDRSMGPFLSAENQRRLQLGAIGLDQQLPDSPPSRDEAEMGLSRPNDRFENLRIPPRPGRSQIDPGGARPTSSIEAPFDMSRLPLAAMDGRGDAWPEPGATWPSVRRGIMGRRDRFPVGQQSPSPAIAAPRDMNGPPLRALAMGSGDDAGGVGSAELSVPPPFRRGIMGRGPRIPFRLSPSPAAYAPAVRGRISRLPPSLDSERTIRSPRDPRGEDSPAAAHARLGEISIRGGGDGAITPPPGYPEGFDGAKSAMPPWSRVGNSRTPAPPIAALEGDKVVMRGLNAAQSAALESKLGGMPLERRPDGSLTLSLHDAARVGSSESGNAVLSDLQGLFEQYPGGATVQLARATQGTPTKAYKGPLPSDDQIRPEIDSAKRSSLGKISPADALRLVRAGPLLPLQLLLTATAAGGVEEVAFHGRPGDYFTRADDTHGAYELKGRDGRIGFVSPISLSGDFQQHVFTIRDDKERARIFGTGPNAPNAVVIRTIAETGEKRGFGVKIESDREARIFNDGVAAGKSSDQINAEIERERSRSGRNPHFDINAIRLWKPPVGRMAPPDARFDRSIEGTTRAFNPNRVRYSQENISDHTRDDIPLDILIKRMKREGWQGEPVDVIRMSDGSVSSVDNRRIFAARRAGIHVVARVRRYDEPLNRVDQKRFASRKRGFFPKTWGEAVIQRIRRQPNDFASQTPLGSFSDPRIMPKNFVLGDE